MDIPNIINYLKTHLDQTDITLNPGASQELIARFEEARNSKLPDDIRLFYEFSNGFNSKEDDFNIVPLEDLADITYHEELFIAQFLIYCDAWELEIDLNNPDSYGIFVIQNDSSKIVLTNSFAEFLQRFLNGGLYGKGGLYDWAEELQRQKQDHSKEVVIVANLIFSGNASSYYRFPIRENLRLSFLLNGAAIATPSELIVDDAIKFNKSYRVQIIVINQDVLEDLIYIGNEFHLATFTILLAKGTILSISKRFPK
ncbi:MAG: SMI1/KNR4 family protein [Mucilaginibacter sp.]|uniref:SMI1/KNR4 family protein n=1 Tax=Mucilaginibacter sp. TaxID=1882438 RepID=UPI0032645DCD